MGFKGIFRKKWVVHLCLGGLLAFFLSCAAAGYAWWRSFHNPVDRSIPIQLVIPRGSSLEKVSSLLESHHIISSSLTFQWMVRFLGKASKIKAGEYLFPPSTSPAQILDQLCKGKTVLHFLTVPEGLSSRDIVRIVTEAPFLEGEIRGIPSEGTLLPETWACSLGDSRQEILKRMGKSMRKAVHEIWSTRSPGCFLKDWQQLVILASIVEKETANPDERSRIAAVFLNRLKIGMPLQSDPTVIFALEQLAGMPLERDLKIEDLKTAHPYNTYQIISLPPGPICNPGIASLKAVAHPLLHCDDLYFVADGTGNHVFSKTWAEHHRNHINWRRIRRSASKPAVKKGIQEKLK